MSSWESAPIDLELVRAIVAHLPGEWTVEQWRGKWSAIATRAADHVAIGFSIPPCAWPPADQGKIFVKPAPPLPVGYTMADLRTWGAIRHDEKEPRLGFTIGRKHETIARRIGRELLPLLESVWPKIRAAVEDDQNAHDLQHETAADLGNLQGFEAARPGNGDFYTSHGGLQFRICRHGECEVKGRIGPETAKALAHWLQSRNVPVSC